MAQVLGQPGIAKWSWLAGTVPEILALGISMARDLMAGRMESDAVALISMIAALALGAGPAAIVVGVMYAVATCSRILRWPASECVTAYP